ncbi:SDR family oxidoreductase [Thalassobacter stenotrophicus]|uniref:2-keto-3-deoxy-L-fuconate dehydrogenase n=2 Tax=Thalassobacter stenotrophicus TaxID=266809 RepID=A0A0P1EY55_9RHOB|nr:SDR family oxidoreductase [Thalassobacter stenotrophicus]PVZ49707.1 NAD(P)-dependent oxidoreductase [Thalassobacter stenotrophicus]CUH59867.1 2-keto-3-deoxy-L-fuconate dehydrogenase [Thalassobacter stenotrophicus]SHJ16162.1 2-keto-3-deoxy-L-fuconate dehydrogenase [Thalassobacter stenotrophicus DSM 16310]
MTRLAGKRAFVTAAGQGIGRACVEALTANGAQVIATDLNADLLEGLDAEKAFALDVLDKDALQAAVKDASPDILVNCAGHVHGGSVLEVSDDDFAFAMHLNVRAQMHAIQAALPGMIDKGRGSIINIASVASSVMGLPNRCIYGTSKAAVIGLTKSVAADFVTKGITCNAIAPGTVDSPSLHDRLKATGDYDAAMAAFVARQPMGRIGTAPEIADLVVYLGSDETQYMTGQCISIDGGMTI